MADRLAELRAGTRLPHVEITVDSDSIENGPTKLKTPLLESSHNDASVTQAAKASMTTFLSDIELAQARIGDIKRVAREISEQADLLLSMSGTEESSITTSVQGKIESTNKIAMTVKRLLTKLDEGLE